jgi:hypothetical protein
MISEETASNSNFIGPFLVELAESALQSAEFAQTSLSRFLQGDNDTAFNKHDK